MPPTIRLSIQNAKGRKAHNSDKIDQIFIKNYPLAGGLLIIFKKLTKFQSPSSNSFFTILYSQDCIEDLQCMSRQRDRTPEIQIQRRKKKKKKKKKKK